MLKKRFGDPFAVAATCRKKLESWPKIHPNDSFALRKYSDFLVQCQKLKKIGSLRVLNNDHENRKLVSKLQYCAKVMQTKFVEIRPLFLRLFYEKSLNFRKMFRRVLSEKIMIFLENLRERN